MKTLKFTAGMMAVAIAMTGCTATKNLLAKRDNGSLDYRAEQKLAPIQLPVQQPSAEFIPVYQTPTVSGETPAFTNESGKQYALPKPPTVR